MPTLMVSISGIRGIVGDGLDPQTLVTYASAYADFVGKGKVVVGRDSRITGEMVNQITCGVLQAKGLDVIDIGICPTPTVQYNVKKLDAQGGIAISASHNPNEWNALKLLNSTGQFMNAEENKQMLGYVDTPKEHYALWDTVGTYTKYEEGLKNHKNDVLQLRYIDKERIRKRNFKVVVDCVNGAGVYVIPELLRDYGCEVIEVACEKNGVFPRLPEPLPENLTDVMKAVKEHKADLGVVVDPDADRLVLITDEGKPFSEEYTITQAVAFLLAKEKGDVVINLSTTRAVEDVAKAAGCKVFRSPVGEANVVQMMKETGAIIGGEGSGGVIYPTLHYGRDSLVGVAITLQHLVEFGGTITELKKSLPQYEIFKIKIDIGDNDPDAILSKMIKQHSDENINTDDGLRIDKEDHWVHLRKSNTEPIIRIVAEASTKEKAEKYAKTYMKELRSFYL